MGTTTYQLEGTSSSGTAVNITQVGGQVVSAGSLSVFNSPPNLPAGYLPRAEDNTATGNQPLYIGYSPYGTAQSAASWAIMQLQYDANGNVNQSFLFGSVSAGIPASNLIWNNRASYTYS
jgi:hypothetical protein